MKNNLVSLSVFLVVMFLGSFVVFFSVWQGQYTVDPHHWGLMLSNAKDLGEGKLPYKDIFIQYGVLTTLIQLWGFKWLGQDLLSLIWVTAPFYALGLLFFYLIALETSKNLLVAFLATLAAFLFHPLAMSPWPNYLASAFVFGGVYFLLRPKGGFQVLGGILFGLAVLCREGLFLPLVTMILFFAFVDGVSEGLRKSFKDAAFALLGVLIPLLFFMSYLFQNDLFSFWKIQSLDWPKVFAKEFFPAKQPVLLSLAINASRNILLGLRSFDGRWILLLGTPVICFGMLTQWLRGLKFNKPHDSGITSEDVKLALSSLVLLISVIHGVEVFRFATASAIGFIPATRWFAHRKHHLIIGGLLAWMALTLFSWNSGNYFFPKENYRQLNLSTNAVTELKRQKWPKQNQKYYWEIQSALRSERLKKCKIKYQYNMTRDSLMATISPFPQLQLAPFYVSELLESIRPEKTQERKAVEASQLIIIREVDLLDQKQSLPNHLVFKELERPVAAFFEGHKITQLLIPNKCK